jgi:hypothetical protein
MSLNISLPGYLEQGKTGLKVTVPSLKIEFTIENKDELNKTLSKALTNALDLKVTGVEVSYYHSWDKGRVDDEFERFEVSFKEWSVALDLVLKNEPLVEAKDKAKRKGSHLVEADPLDVVLHGYPELTS